MGLAKKRRGSLILEAAISSLLLVTATVALLKFAKSASTLNQQADQRLGLMLAVESTLQRLNDVPKDSLSEESVAIAETISKRCKCDIQVDLDPFESNGLSGIHLRVQGSGANQAVITLHDWRFDTEEAADE
ncbi:hypothetical protein [Novipirellula artificiosorum]|uniref:Uncharacterized protein n=1 Tax=Novipirellula artificiosorum TaxID=2528016 RepID=A0A5C6D6W8_9BACT|nr:hypothetical protein [Novipirellula artificiosorum]TWU32568.1 hypothetical protein Poly41_55460 [Novipirellula artificiosorum]